MIPSVRVVMLWVVILFFFHASALLKSLWACHQISGSFRLTVASALWPFTSTESGRKISPQGSMKYQIIITTGGGRKCHNTEGIIFGVAWSLKYRFLWFKVKHHKSHRVQWHPMANISEITQSRSLLSASWFRQKWPNHFKIVHKIPTSVLSLLYLTYSVLFSGSVQRHFLCVYH